MKTNNLDNDQFVLRQLSVGLMQNFSYLIASRKTKEAIVIDPAWEVSQILKEAESLGLKIKHVFLTHTHFDHMNGLEKLLKKRKANVYVNENEISQVKTTAADIVPVKNNSELEVGGIPVRFIQTPGHTAGSQCIYISNFLFTGDTLFVHNTGRTDLDTSDRREMFQSLRTLSGLPPETVVLPGHDYGPTPTSTIAEENQRNPFVRIHDLNAFLQSG